MKFLALFKEEDHRKALYASLIFIMLMILFFLLVSLKEPNPPLKEEIIEVVMPDVEIEQGSESEGGSSESEEKVEEPANDVIEEPARNVVTQKDESVKVNKSNGNTNNNNNKNEPKPDSDLTFPGSSTGQGTTDGSGFGEKDGVGDGGTGNAPGNGAGSRKVTQAPVFDANAQEEGRVALDIWVDENGNVVKTRYKESKSSTGSQYLIDLAVKAAKTMKYSKRPGVSAEHVGYKVFEFTKS